VKKKETFEDGKHIGKIGGKLTNSEIVAKRFLNDMGLEVELCDPFRVKGIPDFFCHNEKSNFYCEVKQLEYGEKIKIGRLLTDSQKKTFPKMISEGCDVKLIVVKGNWKILLNLDEELNCYEIGRSKSAEEFSNRKELTCITRGRQGA